MSNYCPNCTCKNCSSRLVNYPEDCKRIQTIARDMNGDDISLHQAQALWEDHSNAMSAGWVYLTIYSDAEIASIIKSPSHD